MNTNPMSEKELAKKLGHLNGTYDFDVLSADSGVSKNGNDMIVLELGIWSEDGTQYKEKDWLVDSQSALCQMKVRHFCAATGLMEHYSANDLQAIHCQGAAGKVKVITVNDPQYGPKRKITDYVFSGSDDDYSQAAAKPSPPQGVPAPQARAAQAAAVARGADDEVPF